MGTNRRLSLWITACIAIASSTPASSEPAGWPRFRGHDGAGVVNGKLPKSMDEDSIAWKIDLKSTDVGSASILGDRVYFQESVPLPSGSPSNHSMNIRCVELASGNDLWTKAFPQAAFKTHSRNTLAGSTPTIDQDGVYVAWQDGDRVKIAMIDDSGSEVWLRDLGTWQSSHGFATSPVIVGDLVLLLNSQQADELEPGQTPAESFLMALNKSTGEDVWQTPLKSNRVSYGLPAVACDDSGSPTAIIAANTGNGMFAVNPKNGVMMWQIPVFDKRSCSSTLLHRTAAGVDLVIGTCGSGGGGNSLSAIRLSNSGATATPSLAYQIKKAAPYVPTPVIINDDMLTIDDRGIASLIDIQSGDVKKTTRVGGNFGASPIIVGDELLIIDLKGNATVLSVADLSKIRSFDLGDSVGATPAFANGKLLVRVGDRLICYSDEH